MDRITEMPITMLAHHPKNPRLDLGDLTELIESIKQKGILQNLTVVPAKHEDDRNEYWVLIGNRRFEAAKKAGLDRLPCVVAFDLSEREQVEIMLLENMQRTDLTIYEQAEGFQMMLDLGGTKDDIVEKTGFSKSTVDKRLKLLNLDKEEFKAASERETTLEDFIKIAAIEDEEKRNEVLKAAGTKDFNFTLNRITREIEQAAWFEEAVKEVAKWATEIKEVESGHRYLDSFSYWYGKVEKPDYDGEMYYRAKDTGITIYCLDEDEEETEEDHSEDVREEHREKLQELWEAATQTQTDYLMNITESKWKELLGKIFCYLITSEDIYEEDNVDRALEVNYKDDAEREQILGIRKSEIRMGDKPFTYIGRFMAFCAFDPRYNRSPVSRWGYELYDPIERMTKYEEMLKDLGYEPSEVEQQLMDGTHPLYKWKEEEDA